ncbi:MAG: DNA-processing protein DprA [Bacteroidales bacterium]|nr:DNA-processing protein DprA [Bacteroidales bacterium]
MNDFEEKVCLCALGKIFGFEPKTGTALIRHLGSAREVFRTGKEQLTDLLGPFSKHTASIRKAAVYEAEDELKRLERQGIDFVGWGQEGYPGLLEECPDAPLGLYIKSSTPATELWKPSASISIVGTRDVSQYGKEWCRKTVAELASSEDKPVIISGLALGTDICAHKAAIEFGLPTIAVMATGPDDVYPYRHSAFADMLCKTPGCALVTDYPPGTPPLPIHFLRRNRIIAGLSKATILIESKLKGGGMMTARLAFSYDRDVYALPGRVDDIRSQGCNSLISSKIAEPMTDIRSLVGNLGFSKAAPGRTVSWSEIIESAYKDQTDPGHMSMMKDIMAIIQEERGITIEELAQRMGIGYATASNLITILEMDGFISTDLLQRCSIRIKKN